MKEVKKMQLKVVGRSEDIQEIVSPLVDYMGKN